MKYLPLILLLSIMLTACGEDKPQSGRSSAIATEQTPVKKEPEPKQEEVSTVDETELSPEEARRKQIQEEIDNTRESREEKSVRITGTIRGAAGMSITLDKLGGEQRMVPLKTQVINADGVFELETTTKQWQIYDLRTDKGNIVLLLNGGNYEVEADINQLSQAKVNSTESAQLRNFYLILEEFNKRYDRINKREEEYTQKKKAWKVKRLLDSMPYYNTLIEKEKSSAIKTFIGQNKNSIVAPIAAEKLDFLKHTAFINEVYEHSKQLFPGSSYVKNIGLRLIRFMPLAIGQPAPEIILPNIDGENIKLSSLKGKHTLLYFSVNVVDLTVQGADNLKSIYYQYNSKGFEVYNVAVDETIDDWNAYLETTEAPWITVSDLQGQNSTVFDAYMATEFPMTYLIDDKGIIVDKFVSDDELKAYLRDKL